MLLHNFVTTFSPVQTLTFINVFTSLEVQAVRVIRINYDFIISIITPPADVLVETESRDYHGGCYQSVEKHLDVRIIGYHVASKYKMLTLNNIT